VTLLLSMRQAGSHSHLDKFGSGCRNLTRLLGIHLLTREAIPLLLLQHRLSVLEDARKVCSACVVCAVLAAMVTAFNFVAGGWLPLSWIDVLVCAVFVLLYGVHPGQLATEARPRKEE
jgi:hypothetical protein